MLFIVESELAFFVSRFFVFDNQPEAEVFLTEFFSLFLSFTAAIIAFEGLTFRKSLLDPDEDDFNSTLLKYDFEDLSFHKKVIQR